jgi:hypothetical protein
VGLGTATGAFGQFITVIPKPDLVIAHKTKYEYGLQTSTDVYLRMLDKLEKPISLTPLADLQIPNNRLVIIIKSGQIRIGEEGSIQRGLSR